MICVTLEDYDLRDGVAWIVSDRLERQPRWPGRHPRLHRQAPAPFTGA
jgi:hypothetical protein